MKRFDGAFRSAQAKVTRASKSTAREYAESILPDEPSFTVALATRIHDALRRPTAGGLSWDAKILSSRTEEPQYGADFLGVLNLRLRSYAVSKGFLAQAKRQEPQAPLSTREWKRLNKQCETMIYLSAESFVFVYSREGVFVVPAASVVACSGRQDLYTLHPKPLGAFYRDHFECFVGDRNLHRTDVGVLSDLRYRAGLQLMATESQQTEVEEP